MLKRTGLNETHSGLRIMLMADQRDESYEDSLEDYTRLYGHIDELLSLIKDLKKIVKQVQPKAPRKPKKTTDK